MKTNNNNNNKKILLVGGLWNNKFFEKSIYKQLSRYKNLTFIPCKEVSQADIDANEVIVCYSIAIQYVHKFNLKDKKVILVSPLLNNDYINDTMIFLGNEIIKRFAVKDKIPGPIVSLIFNGCGGDEQSNKLWWNDMRLWVKKYANNETVVDIKPDNKWVIIEGKMPICKLPRIDIETEYGHLIPISSKWSFLDEAI